MTREYGGPEEGGWWFDAAADALADIEKEEDDRTGGLGRYSVLGGADTVFLVEDEPGKDYPEEYPRYE